MKMPIVSLNNMAMNESVAATCCYSHNHINGHYFDSVLNGGALEIRIAETPIYKDQLMRSWLSVTTGDYVEATQGLELTSEFNTVTGAWEYGTYVEGTWTPLAKCTKVDNFNLGYCDHKGEYCSYIKDYKHEQYTAHVGATVAHSASKNWAADHAAIRFNS